MTVTTVDARAKAVLAQIIDKHTTEYPLSKLNTDLAGNMRLAKGQSIDVPVRATPITFEDGTADADLTSQAQAATAYNLVVDQMPAANVDLPVIQNEFDVAGSWSSELAKQILGELNNQVDEEVYEQQIQDVTGAAGVATYWINPGAATLTDDHIRLAMSRMLKQKGVQRSGLVWCMDPYGEGSLASITAFSTNAAQNGLGALGFPTIGSLHGIPVIVSQSVPSSFTVPCTAVVVASNVATVTVAAGHPLVVGHKVTIAGITTPLTTAAAIATAGATSFTVPLTTADATMADGAGTITVHVTCNGLMYRPWSYIAMQRIPTLEVVKREKRPGHFLQAHALYGRKFLPGSFYALGSPSAALTG